MTYAPWDSVDLPTGSANAIRSGRFGDGYPCATQSHGESPVNMAPVCSAPSATSVR